MMNIKQKICLVSGLVLIIAIFLLWGPVKFLTLEIKATSVLIQERKERLLVLEETDQAYLRQLESDYNDIEENISLVRSGFLEAEQVVDFFIELENIGSSTFNKLEIEAGKFPFFTLHLIGNFPSLMKFLGWLENSTYFIDVDSLQIRPFSERSRFLEEETISLGDIRTVLKIRSYSKD